MRIPFFKIYMLLLLLSCRQAPVMVAQTTPEIKYTNDDNTLNGAERINEYLPNIQDKKVAIVANHTSTVGKSHLVDTLISLGIQVVKVFAPEHGFRGMADAGEKVNTGIDEKTGLPIISLYGKNKKPTADQLKDVDVILFDIQDVGARFYTYISTMTYVMEACAENNKQMIVLDRPNPNGHYVDGPVMQKEYTSFVGMHAIPIVHGMTVGEYAQMVNGEKWLTNGVQCELKVITVENYDHSTFYKVPIPPSPNLKTQEAIYLYPTTCLFEGTLLSVGRGTDNPFTMIGHPDFTTYEFCFTPVSKEGAKNPLFMDKKCFGIDFANDASWKKEVPPSHIYIEFILEFYHVFPSKESFFTSFFEKLAGTSELRKMITDGKSDTEIRDSWKKEVEAFKIIRKKYLLYPDFE